MKNKNCIICGSKDIITNSNNNRNIYECKKCKTQWSEPVNLK